jgi:methyl-accepting chemotaxis protein
MKKQSKYLKQQQRSIDMIKKMKIGKKLVVTFILVTVISSMAGIIGLFQMVQMNQSYSDALTRFGFAQGDVGRLYSEFNNSRSDLRAIIIETKADTVKEYSDKLEKSGELIDTYLKQVQKNIDGETESAYFQTIQENFEKYKDLREQVSALALENKKTEANTLLVTDGAPILTKLTETLTALDDEKTERGNQVEGDLSRQSTVALMVMIAGIAVAVVLSLIIALSISRGISKPVKKMAEAAQKMAKGDLKVQIDVTSEDEIGQLGKAFMESSASIRAYIADITESLAEVEHGNLDVVSKMEYIGDYADLKNAY